MNKLQKLTKSSDSYIKEVFSLINGKSKIVGDSILLPSSAIEEMSAIQYKHVQAQHIEHSQTFQSVDEARSAVRVKLAGDMLHNSVNGIGTAIDPSVYTQSEIPVMLGPYDASSTYSPGGLPALIIDKKARAMVMEGATFKAEDKFWTPDKIQQLEGQAVLTGFNDKVADSATDAFVYGGSVLYPVFKHDTAGSFIRKLDTMNLEKGCIDRWVTVDRWNICIVPSYIVTAKDYLKPDSLYIPLGGVEVSTTRASLLKPKPLPYWAALYNLGWCPSDFSGWISAYFGYETVCQSIPVMAQQMSLILYKMPLDSLNATLGANNVEKLMKINEQKMAEWSAVQPKAVNMVGEVEVVDRTYTGLEQLIGAMKSNLASHCGIPEPSLWHTPNKGFSDNTTESLLKQSETLVMLQHFIERCLKPATDCLIAHTFGMDSEEWKNKDKIRISFNKPVISTEKDLAEAGARFAASVSSLVAASVAPDTAIEITQQFFPSVKIDEELTAEIRKDYEEAQKLQQQNMQARQELGQKQGPTMASKGMNNTTGKFTKAK